MHQYPQRNEQAPVLTFESRAACLEMVSRLTSKFAAESCINTSDCIRTPTAACSSASVSWQPSPPNPSKQSQVARQVEVGVSARQSVAFNAAPEVDEMYSQIPRAPPPQLLGQALAGETQIGSAVAGAGSGQLL